MKIGYFAPSYNRPEKSTTQENYPFVKLIVSDAEGWDYRDNGNIVEVCPDTAQGNLCRVRNWILDKFQDEYDCIVLLDDDIGGVFEWQEQEKRKMEGEEFMEFCEMAAIMAEDAGVYFWGVNPGKDKGSYREHTPISFSSYICGSVQAFMKGNKLRYDEKLPLKEDYDMTLQQLKKYHYVLRFNWVVLDVKQSEQEGGCATYRNLDREKEQFFRLQKKWGGKIVTYDKLSKAVFDYNPILKLPY